MVVISRARYLEADPRLTETVFLRNTRTRASALCAGKKYEREERFNDSFLKLLSIVVATQERALCARACFSGIIK